MTTDYGDVFKIDYRNGDESEKLTIVCDGRMSLIGKVAATSIRVRRIGLRPNFARFPAIDSSLRAQRCVALTSNPSRVRGLGSAAGRDPDPVSS